jgi:glutamate dehydrogenase
MNIQGQFASDDERAARRLVEQAGTILKGLRGDMPESFAPLMYAGASPEDLVRYEPRELAEMAEAAWLFLQERKPGASKIRFESRPGPTGAERVKSVSIIELINNDMPFLLDSVMAELTEQGLDVRLVLHPIFTVERDRAGTLVGFRGDGPAVGAAQRESFVHIHVERIEDAARQAEIVAAIEAVLADVRVCVADWRPMMARAGEVIAEIKNNPPPLPVEEIAEATQFLEWLVANNFTFLGVREYALTSDGDNQDYEPIFESGLGILRAPEVRVLRRGSELVSITPEIMEFLKEPKALIITKANVRSRVHRRVYMDYIGVKRFDDDGHLIGEVRIVGLFTSTAYTRSTRSIPYLRRKVDNLMRRSGFDPDSHSGKAFAAVLENYSRDELFQIDEDTLYQFVLAIMHLDERPRVRVLARRDRFDRFVSVMVFVPRERYDSSARVAIGTYLAGVYKGRVSAFYPFFTEGPLVRVHFIIGRTTGETPDPDRAEMERAVEALVRTWTDGLAEALTLVHEPIKAQQLVRRYREAFPVGYREAYVPPVAVADIRLIESLSPIRPLGADFYSRREGDRAGAGLKVWSREKPIALSERVPVLENMGFKVVDERTYRIEPEDLGAAEVWLHDMVLERADGEAIDVEALKARLEATFMAVMRGRAENDGYNALVLGAGLQWRDVALVRTISRYLRQVRVAFSQDYMWATLRRHPAIAAQVVALFHSRFDPRIDLSMEARAESQSAQLAEIETALGAVESLDEDRILRHFVNAVTSGLRTNFYQTENGQPKPTIAIKFDSRKIEGLPLPKPLYEIFVYSPRVEGVHLRFGKVARGGIRWSDRPQDFRTEVLGLVKAQQVKNAVIVPVGAKGGFIPKYLPSGPREAVQAEGTAAYTIFISSLLDITDNLGPDGVIPPENVVRHDGDDSYLVVAADKGTATFSDTANRISLEHEFWLGDAFASGGSAGYDHKKMGITARGAWEAVRRHFREMDVDISATPFTVAGVGDMSGDVFGNGMLRERTIKLVAAFDHRDIFIDPNPDPERSFAERQRLFDLSRSSWQDYNADYLSAGGGIYSRKAKEIALSDEARTLLGLEGETFTPQQVMTAILKLNTDLLWFGGIGTYIRASSESDDQVGDRVNDPIRVTGGMLRCKVIGEGANLGATQKGRVEAAMRGVRLNTDAIDNSAGVNTSDVEVNIKIAVTPVMQDGRLSLEGRDKLLVEMTDEVGRLVLRNNYQQTLALSLAQRRGLEDLGFQQRLMQTLEQRGHLDRAVEYLPDDMELGERRKRGQGLTRPELAVLLAYAKLTLYSDLLDSSVPDDPYLGRELARYFPKELVEQYPDALERHRLRREIISTQLTNSMINRGGPSFAVRIGDQTGAPAAAIAAAFFVVRNSYDMIALNSAIDALDNEVPGKLQLDLYASIEDLLLDRIVWFVRNVDVSKGLEAIVEHYRAGIEAVEGALYRVLPPAAELALVARATELTNAGVPEDLARKLVNLRPLAAAPDIVSVADRTGRPVQDVAATYFAAGAFFQLDRIANAARGIQVTDYFDRLALDRALDQIGEAERRLTAEMVGDGVSGPEAVDAWVSPRAGEVERIRAAVHGIASSGLTLSKVTVAASLLGDLVKH